MIKEGKKKKIEQQLQWIDNILADAKRTIKMFESYEKQLLAGNLLTSAQLYYVINKEYYRKNDVYQGIALNALKKLDPESRKRYIRESNIKTLKDIKQVIDETTDFAKLTKHKPKRKTKKIKL